LKRWKLQAEFNQVIDRFAVNEFVVDNYSPDRANNYDQQNLSSPQIGTVGWIALTIDDCEGTRRFHEQVVGWQSSAVSLGKYDDYCVHPSPDAAPVAGICHA
jgi:hypothetical protein